MQRPEVAVGAVVVHDACLLLVLRGRGVAVGKWSLPGGRVEFGETLADAVVREVREETGITVDVDGLAGWVERTGRDPEPYHFVILDFFCRPTIVSAPAARDDAVDARWVPVGEVAAYDLADGLLDFLRGIGSVLP